MRYLLQVVSSQLVKDHSQEVPFMLWMRAVEEFFVWDKECVKKGTDNLIQRCQCMVVFVTVELVQDYPVKGTWLKGKKGLQKTRPREGKWKNKEEAKGREGVVARMKEAPTRSLREGKEGKEAKKQCCRNGTGDKKY